MKGWIEWRGGECPVGRYETVQIKLRDDNHIERPRSACECDWRHLPNDAGQDIIAYRVVRS